MIFKLLDAETAGGGSVVHGVTSEAAHLYLPPFREGFDYASPDSFPSFQSQTD